MIGTDIKPYIGFLIVYVETGTEGGFWAFQDKSFCRENSTQFACKKCHVFLDKERDSEEEFLKRTQSKPEMMTCEHDFELTSLMLCSYEGLHVLGSGDYLRIFSKEDSATVLWEGTVKLDVSSDTLVCDVAGNPTGYSMHSEPIDIDKKLWREWFYKEHLAELIPGT